MTYQEQNPLSYEYICEKQQAEKQLLAIQQKYPEQYINMNLDDDVDDIICYMKQGQDPIHIGRSSCPQLCLIHLVMEHPGEK